MRSRTVQPRAKAHPRPGLLVAAAFGLFIIWSNSFIAIAYVLGSDGAGAQLDWIGLTVARFLPASAICAVYCFGFRRAESLITLRRHWRRLLVCGALIVPGYNFALYYAQQHGIPAPIASLTTALVPLFVMVLAAAFLGERPTARRLVGFSVAVLGMSLISLAKPDASASGYALLVAVTAVAPLCWSAYSVASKPLAGRVSPIVWTYLATTLGGLMVSPLLPLHAWRQTARIDATGWLAVAYLAIPCTVLGFAVWTWLLKHLPASTVGFTVFLNPPLTTASKYLLASLAPSIFFFNVRPQEWFGGAITLIGLAITVYAPRRA